MLTTEWRYRCGGRFCCFFFQAEDGIRDLVRSRGLGDVYKRQVQKLLSPAEMGELFKVLALARTAGIDWPGFAVVDLSLLHI